LLILWFYGWPIWPIEVLMNMDAKNSFRRVEFGRHICPATCE
jgi:hypothetical protein